MEGCTDGVGSWCIDREETAALLFAAEHRVHDSDAVVEIAVVHEYRKKHNLYLFTRRFAGGPSGLWAGISVVRDQ